MHNVRMRDLLHNLRLLGFALFIACRWIEVLRLPSLILVTLTSLGLLYDWRQNSKFDNIWNIIIAILSILVMTEY